jgi:hypothetical protein
MGRVTRTLKRRRTARPRRTARRHGPRPARPRRQARRRVGVAAATLACLLATRPAHAAEIRAAYFYHYMTPGHLDTLANAGFNRALVRIVADSLDAGRTSRLGTLAARGAARGITVVPDLLFQSVRRLEALPTRRRYAWGLGTREARVACPLDTTYWKSAFFERAEEILAAIPAASSIAIDLEIHDGGRRHYDAGACRCSACLAEYTGLPGGSADRSDVWELSGLSMWEEAALSQRLTNLFVRFAQRHPGVEIGVLDLDLDSSFVHRALARALDRARIPTVDYTECSYREGGDALAAARGRLDALGFTEARLVGGLWLKRWPPDRIATGVRSVLDRADGYFVFTTYSLWKPPAQLTGPYTLPGSPADYWRALGEVNRTP